MITLVPELNAIPHTLAKEMEHTAHIGISMKLENGMLLMVSKDKQSEDCAFTIWKDGSLVISGVKIIEELVAGVCKLIDIIKTMEYEE